VQKELGARINPRSSTLSRGNKEISMEHPMSKVAFSCRNQQEFHQICLWLMKSYPEVKTSTSHSVHTRTINLSWPLVSVKGGPNPGFAALNRNEVRHGKQIVIPVSSIPNLPEIPPVKVGTYEVLPHDDGMKVGCYTLSLERIQEVLGVIGMKAVAKNQSS
jgi:hypothetical protein